MSARAKALVALVIAMFASIGGLVLVTLGLLDVPGGSLPLGLALLVVPWIGYVLIRRAARSEGLKAFNATLASGFPARHRQWFSGSGLALDPGAGQLLVSSRGVARIYPLSELSECRYVAETGGNLGVAGIGDLGVFGLILSVFAISSASSAHLQSGLHLRFRDGRRWQIFGIDTKQAEDWQKLLQAPARAA